MSVGPRVDINCLVAHSRKERESVKHAKLDMYVSKALAYAHIEYKVFTLPCSLSLFSLKFNVRQNRKRLPRERGPKSRKKFQYENSSAWRDSSAWKNVSYIHTHKAQGESKTLHPRREPETEVAHPYDCKTTRKFCCSYAPTKSEPPASSSRSGLISTSRSTVYPVRETRGN